MLWADVKDYIINIVSTIAILIFCLIICYRCFAFEQSIPNTVKSDHAGKCNSAEKAEEAKELTIKNFDFIQAGSGSTNGNEDVTITFKTAFSFIPEVFVQTIGSPVEIILDVVDKSSTDFTVRARNIFSGNQVKHKHGRGSPLHTHKHLVDRVALGSDNHIFSGNQLPIHSHGRPGEIPHTHSLHVPEGAVNFDWIAVNWMIINMYVI